MLVSLSGPISDELLVSRESATRMWGMQRGPSVTRSAAGALIARNVRNVMAGPAERCRGPEEG